jgi:hypothetical protein
VVVLAVITGIALSRRRGAARADEE